MGPDQVAALAVAAAAVLAAVLVQALVKAVAAASAAVSSASVAALALPRLSSRPIRNIRKKPAKRNIKAQWFLVSSWAPTAFPGISRWPAASASVWTKKPSK